jgi:excisionase family DNA binding protein
MSTGNSGLDLLADAIAGRVMARMLADKPEPLLTVEEAAKYLGRSARAVRHLIATGSLPVVREGRSIRLDRRELDRWIELRQSRG